MLKIEYWKTADVIPYKNNPRNNEEAVQPVAESIRAFGFKSPIVVDENGIIIAGHTRLKAAKRLGLDQVPVIIASDLAPEKVAAYRLADNKSGEFSQWNEAALFQELDKIENIDMSAFGFFVQDPALEIDEDPEETESDLELITLNFSFSPEEYDTVEEALRVIGKPAEYKGNKSKKGNSLFEVYKIWDAQKI